MKLEVGMYVRIKNKVGYCVIGKIENINDFREPSMKYCIDIQSDDFVFIPEDMISKTSHNIIDLIEVGDIVVSLNGANILEYNLMTLSNIDELKDLWNIQKNIKSIVTKEQFESVSYKVDE